MHRMIRALSLATLCSCNTTRTPASTPPTQRATHTMNDAVSDASSPDLGSTLTIGDATWSGRCADIVSRMQAVKARLPSACQQDSDCQCYVGGIAGVTGCGGASDADTAAQIARIQAEFRAARCDYGVNCSPRLCDVRCVNQRCVER